MKPGFLPGPIPGPIEIGYVARAHGIRGEVRVVLHDPESTTLTEVEQISIAGKTFDVAHARPVRGACLVGLVGITDRNQAERLRGNPVFVDRDLIPLQDGEVFLADLVGCRVMLPDGQDYGEVAAIQPGPQDLLVIHHDSVERLLPFVPVFVDSIDLDQGQIVVTPPEDLPETPLSE